MQPLIIPNDAFNYILLQRTEYQMPINKYFRRIHLDNFYDNYILQWIDVLRKNKRLNLYTNDMRLEYNTIKNFLPTRANAILDIGCGMAGIDIFLYRHYSTSEPILSLLDKEGISKEIYYGYHGMGAFYNSLAVAKEFLIANAVPPDKIIASNVDAGGFPKGNAFDVILSLISWGFHYPVEVYLDDAYDALSDAGVLIIDIRSNTGGKQILSEKFSSVETIATSTKYERVLATK